MGHQNRVQQLDIQYRHNDRRKQDDKAQPFQHIISADGKIIPDDPFLLVLLLVDSLTDIGKNLRGKGIRAEGPLCLADDDLDRRHQYM